MPAVANTTTLGNMGRVILGTSSGSILLAKVFDFEWRRTDVKKKVEIITAERFELSIPSGYSGRFSFDRTSSAVEAAFVADDEIKDGIGVYEPWQVVFQIVDLTGAGSTQLKFYGCACDLTQGGVYRQNSVVTQTVSFQAASMNYQITGDVGNAGGIISAIGSALGF